MRLNKSSKDEQQRFRGTTASAISLSGNAATSSSPSTRRVFTQQSAANATSSQRVAALFHDVKRYIRQKQQRHWRSNDSLPLNHSSHGNKYHKVGSTSDKAWHVDIPKRMVFSTMLVFLLLPLTIFYWKETHLPDQEESAVVESKIGYNQQSLHSSQHNAFPNWFADSSLPHSSSDSSRDDENDLQFNNNINNNNNNNNIPQQQREDATPEAALKALEGKVTQPLLDDGTNTTAHDIQQQQDPDVLELSKVQFVNDTEIPDNDPLSDPETAPKINGGRVDDDGDSSSAPLP